MWKLNITNLLVVLLSPAAALVSVYTAIHAEDFTSINQVRGDNVIMAIMFSSMALRALSKIDE